MPKGGFGNLIALPCKRNHVKMATACLSTQRCIRIQTNGCFLPRSSRWRCTTSSPLSCARQAADIRLMSLLSMRRSSSHRGNTRSRWATKCQGRCRSHSARPWPISSIKWARELDYRLIKELWSFTDNRIAVRFAYEWHDDAGSWFRSYGNENWQFTPEGLMARRFASINDLPIKETDRKFRWARDNNSRRPDDHASLSALGL